MRTLLSFIFLITSCFATNAIGALPDKFYKVSTGIYRSAQPTASDYQDLRGMGIKTVLTLNNDQRTLAAETRTARDAGIKLIARPMSAFSTPRNGDVNADLEDLRNPDNYPILIHCKHGEDRTGMIVGLYRVEVEGIRADEAYREMLDYNFHQRLYSLDEYFKQRTGLN